MASVLRRCLALAAALSLVAAIGCGEDPEERVTENQPPQNGVEVPEGELVHHGDCADVESEHRCDLTTTVGFDQTIEVRLLDGHGNPVEDALINFALDQESGADVVELDSQSSFTDGDGVASVDIYAGDAESPQDAVGAVTVEAEVADNPEINTLDFHLTIDSKHMAAYRIDFLHEGDAQPDRVRPVLYDSNEECDDLRTQFFEDDSHQWPGGAVVQLSAVDVHPDGTIPTAIHPQVQNGEAFTVLGVAEQEIDGQYVEVAYGCADDNPPVEDGISVEVEVPLDDHIPFIAHPGGYDVVHSFDLTEAMPGPLATIIELLATLSDSPAKFIFGCPDDEWTHCDSEQIGLIDLILDFIPGDSIQDNVDTLMGNEVLHAGAIEVVNSWIEEQTPDWWSDTATGVSDVMNAFQNFTVAGSMTFENQPTPDIQDGQVVGHLTEEDTRQVWRELIFQWELGCEDAPNPDECAEVVMGADDIGVGPTTETIEGEFEATLYGSDALHIEHHTMAIHYGNLLMAVVENVVFPRIFGEDITSVEDLFNSLIDCESLAESASGETEGTFYEAIEGLCEDLQGEAAQAVYDYVDDMVVGDDEGQDYLRLGTPVDNPCSIQQPESYPTDNWPGNPLPFVDTFGQPDDGERCEWETEVRFGGDLDDEPSAELTGQFDGELGDF